MLDVEKIKSDFPILNIRVNGKRIVYLDNTATSQKPIQVINAIKEFYEKYNANVHRGMYRLSIKSTELYENSRKKIVKFINARSSREIVFVRNTSEAINLIAYSWGLNSLKKDDVILVTEMEHHSNLLPWQMLNKLRNTELRYIKIDKKSMELDLSNLDKFNKSNVRLVSIAHVSNVLGTINPVRDICRWAHDLGAICHADMAQSAPHMPVNVRDLDVDFASFSGHKMLGPTGIGVLYGKEEIFESMPPFMRGGEMISHVTKYRAEWNELPWKFEAGTPNYVGAYAYGVAIDYLNNVGMNSIRKHEEKLSAYALDKLNSLNDIRVFGPLDIRKRGGVFSFVMKDMHAHDIATLLDKDNIYVRSGVHCAEPLAKVLHVPATARASVYLYNNEEDIDSLANSLKKIKRLFLS